MKHLPFAFSFILAFVLIQPARSSDGHLAFFQKLNESDVQGAKKSLKASLRQDDRMTGEVLFFKAGLAYVTWNNHEKGTAELIDWCKRQLEKQEEPFSCELIDAYLVMAQYYLDTYSEQALAEKYLFRSNSILSDNYETGNYRYGIYYYLKGLLNARMYDQVNAIQYFSMSVKLTAPVPELREYYYRSHLGMLDAMSFLSDYGKSLSIADSCIAECKHEGRSPADFYHRKGVVLYMLGDSVNAIKCFLKGMEQASTVTSKNSALKSQLFYNMGLVSRSNHKHVLFMQALKTAESFENNEWLVYLIKQDLALWYYYKKDYVNCLRYAQQSLIAGSYNFSDTDYFHNPAIDQFRPYYGLIETLGIKGNAFIRLNPRWNADTRTYTFNNLDNSLEAVELAAKLTEKFLFQVREENSGLTITENRKRILNNVSVYATMAYGQTKEKRYALQAFNASERCKMQFLRIRISQKENLQKAGIPVSLINRLENLDKTILFQENHIIRAEKSGNDDLKTLAADLTRYYNRRDSLNYELHEQYPAYKSDYHPKIRSVKEVQQYLGDDQALIEYSLVMQEVIIFAITRDTLVVEAVLIDSNFLKEIENLRLIVSSNPLDTKGNQVAEFCRSSGYLYKFLIEPVRDIIKGKRLIIVPHNELSLIPFEVLMPYKATSRPPFNFGALPYLVRDFPISYAYSATFLLEKGQTLKQHAKGIGIFVPGYSHMRTDTFFAELAGAQYEAKLINRFMNSRLFSGTRANEFKFKNEAHRFSILHIASHTLIDENHPALSCLVLDDDREHNEDGFVYAYELSEIQLNARLVMLSGCNTGFGKLRLSEGLVSIARSFFYTGVRTVGFTLWNVADQAGARLTSLFYEGLRHRQTLDVAMRDSKMDFITNTDPVKSHPYFWANYLVVGNTDAIKVHRVPAAVWYAVAAMLIAVVVWLIRQKDIRKKA